jgi:predicted RNase H-like HicB family nuclease
LVSANRRNDVLPGCITEGDSMEEALEAARDAIRLYPEDLAAEGTQAS